MKHGTGLCWERQYKADLQTDKYAVITLRLFNYYYPQMSDCYEPYCEAKDKYKIRVIVWRKDFHNKKRRVADHICKQVETPSISAEEANKIYWNLKNRNIPFEEVKKYFQSLA